MSAKITLEHCPFFGNHNSIHLFAHGCGIAKFFIVRCETGLGGCGASVTGATRRLAAENWNRRCNENGFRLRVKDLAPCNCDCSLVKLELRSTPSASPMVAPLYEVRIVCENCKRSSPWAEDYKVVQSFWNEMVKGK